MSKSLSPSSYLAFAGFIRSAGSSSIKRHVGRPAVTRGPRNGTRIQQVVCGASYGFVRSAREPKEVTLVQKVRTSNRLVVDMAALPPQVQVNPHLQVQAQVNPPLQVQVQVHVQVRWMLKWPLQPCETD